jgi:hypothetical protein
LSCWLGSLFFLTSPVVVAPPRPQHHLALSTTQGGDSIEDSLNKIIAKSACVKAVDDDGDVALQEPTHWWDGTPIRHGGDDDDDDSSHTDDDPKRPPPALRPEWHWPEGCCPYYRTAFKQRSKNFIDHHGSIYQDVHARLRAVMMNHQWAATTAPSDQCHAVFANIIPSFFTTLRDLYADDHQPRRHHQESSPLFDRLTIVLRTYGSDLTHIRRAIHWFASGRHPDFPDFVEPKLQQNMTNSDIGDDSSSSSSASFVKGRWVPIVLPNNDDAVVVDAAAAANQPSHETTCSYEYQLTLDDGTVVASGDQAVLDYIHAHDLCGIADDYHFWNDHDYEPWAGKPVWVLSNNDDDDDDRHCRSSGTANDANATDDALDTHYHHVLFDDNMYATIRTDHFHQ